MIPVWNRDVPQKIWACECLMCDGESAIVGLWEPEIQEFWGGSKERIAGIAYVLCEYHTELSESEAGRELIEDQIIKRWWGAK